MINFKLRLRGESGFDDYTGQIVGFSNRIHSILVPLDFLSWANNKYGYFEKNNPSQVIVVSKNPTDPSIIRFLEEKGYDTIREKLKSSRMNIILKLIISFLVVVAAIIIGLAFLVFMLSLQLMISRSSEKIRRLNKLGFHYREISRPYILLLLILMTAVTGFSLIITSLLAGKFHTLAQEWSLNISDSLHGILFGMSMGLIALISLANVASILISTKKLCK